VFSHHSGTATLASSTTWVAGLDALLARMQPAPEGDRQKATPAPGMMRVCHPTGVKQGSTHGDGVAVIFALNNTSDFVRKARSTSEANTRNGAPVPLEDFLRWLRTFNLGKGVIHFPVSSVVHSFDSPHFTPPHTGTHFPLGEAGRMFRFTTFHECKNPETSEMVAPEPLGQKIVRTARIIMVPPFPLCPLPFLPSLSSLPSSLPPFLPNFLHVVIPSCGPTFLPSFT
jgi:hypothetical protein